MRHREALASRRLERPKKLSHLSANWWAEITSNQYNFDRDAVEVAHLRTLSKQDVIDFYKVSECVFVCACMLWFYLHIFSTVCYIMPVKW